MGPKVLFTITPCSRVRNQNICSTRQMLKPTAMPSTNTGLHFSKFTVFPSVLFAPTLPNYRTPICSFSFASTKQHASIASSTWHSYALPGST